MLTNRINQLKKVLNNLSNQDKVIKLIIKKLSKCLIQKKKKY